MPYSSVVHGKFRAIAYLLWQGHDAIVIDPPRDSHAFDGLLADNCLSLRAILCTHIHVDHVIGCGAWQRRTGLPVFASGQDIAAADGMLSRAPKYGMIIEAFTPQALAEGPHAWGMINLEAILVPGHSPGAFCYHVPDEKLLFSGDSLFRNVLPRMDFPESLPHMLIPALKRKIFTLPPETAVLPGHGKSSQIGLEAGNAIYAQDLP